MHIFTPVLTLVFVNIIKAQINLAPLGYASQKSTYFTNDASKAIDPPASHKWVDGCTHTKNQSGVWWKVEFNGKMFFTNVIIYYRKDFPYRMDGFSLYVTNLSDVSNPPVGHLCYRDDIPGNPNIYQNINCYAVGRNVIFFNTRNTFIELCYLQTFGCLRTFWGNTCENPCSVKCIDQHCFPGNGSCVFGCNSGLCTNHNCDSDTICKTGCISGRAGQHCDKYNNIALHGSSTQSLIGTGGIALNASLASDNDRTSGSCVYLTGTDTWLQVDLKDVSVVTAIYLHFGNNGGSNTIGAHMIYGTNTSQSWAAGIELYNGPRPTGDISFPSSIVRYVIYIPPSEDSALQLNICEMEVVGCHVGRYGHKCGQSCAVGCNGPCHPETADCLFGCHNGWKDKFCNQKCPDGTFGKNCTGICSSNCFALCHHVTGECIGGCIEGYHGFYCSKECSNGNYGRNCNKSCDGCLSEQCDRFNGNCKTANKCKPGWIFSEKCDKPCENWYYGDNCRDKCNCLTDPCDKSSGICSGGCIKGWKGTACNQICPLGNFGVNCSQSCDGCPSNLCDRFDGVCNSNGTCRPGWVYSNKCNQPCDDEYYGHNCSQRCFCLDEPCNKSTGKCKGGCQKGYEGTTCNQKCSTGHFGYSCNRSCDGCIHDDCDSFEGICILNDKCKPGWLYEPTCSTPCDNLHYGDNCTRKCNCTNMCNKITGHCTPLEDKLDSSSAGIGGGISAVAIVLLLVTTVVLYIRRRNKKQENDNHEYVDTSKDNKYTETMFHNTSYMKTAPNKNTSEWQLYRVLQKANLLQYYDIFIRQGGDDVQQLCEAGKKEFSEIMTLVGMASKPLHVRRLQKTLKEWMTNPDLQVTNTNDNRWSGENISGSTSHHYDILYSKSTQGSDNAEINPAYKNDEDINVYDVI